METTDVAGEPESASLTEEDQAAIDEPESSAAAVTYSGTDFDIDGLVRRLNRGDVLIPSFGTSDETIETAGFQRSFVWKRPQMDKFIESLLLGYPIPGIILVEQQDKRYLVLDGQQRLRTLQAFYTGVYDRKEFSLQNVAPEFAGLTYAKLPSELRRQLDNTFIQATIVKTDGTDKSLDAVYQVFERLNSGGTQLTPHEIRVALYAGPFVTFLADLNNEASWRALYGPTSPRLRDQEIVLRVIALFVSSATYKRPLKTFLNDFVNAHRSLEKFPAEHVRNLFAESGAAILAGPGRAALRVGGNQINAAMTEALYVAVMRRLESGPIDAQKLATVVSALEGSEDLGTSLTRATADEESVRTRLSVVTRLVAQI